MFNHKHKDKKGPGFFSLANAASWGIGTAIGFGAEMSLSHPGLIGVMKPLEGFGPALGGALIGGIAQTIIFRGFSRHGRQTQIEGLHHGGQAEQRRQQTTEFGSGWQGLDFVKQMASRFKLSTVPGALALSYKGKAFAFAGVPVAEIFHPEGFFRTKFAGWLSSAGDAHEEEVWKMITKSHLAPGRSESVIAGLPHGGTSSALRRGSTDFGSGYQGIMSNREQTPHGIIMNKEVEMPWNAKTLVSRNRAVNERMGFGEGGVGSAIRKVLSSFGSGWQGLDKEFTIEHQKIGEREFLGVLKKGQEEVGYMGYSIRPGGVLEQGPMQIFGEFKGKGHGKGLLTEIMREGKRKGAITFRSDPAGLSTNMIDTFKSGERAGIMETFEEAGKPAYRANLFNLEKNIMKMGEGAAIAKAGTAEVPAVLRATSRIIKSAL